MLEKTPECPLECKIKPVNPKGNQPWILTGRTDAKAEAPILWPPDMKSRLIGKYPDAGKDWGQKEKGAAEGETVRWHPQLNGQEFEQTPGDSGEEETGVLQSMGLQRDGHDLATKQQSVQFSSENEKEPGARFASFHL